MKLSPMRSPLGGHGTRVTVEPKSHVGESSASSGFSSSGHTGPSCMGP